jgi:alpha-1,3/alpha-1,6-mannosyltransferase
MGDDLEKYKQELSSCDYFVQAIGYEKQPGVHHIVTDKTRLKLHRDLVYDHETAEFTDKEGNKIPGLYGAGIAFPEKVVDPEGNVEYAVGLAKFMKYLKRVVPNWNGGPASHANGEECIVRRVESLAGYRSVLGCGVDM